jgi:hypothetical protein
LTFRWAVPLGAAFQRDAEYRFILGGKKYPNPLRIRAAGFSLGMA